MGLTVIMGNVITFISTLFLKGYKQQLMTEILLTNNNSCRSIYLWGSVKFQIVFKLNIVISQFSRKKSTRLIKLLDSFFFRS